MHWIDPNCLPEVKGVIERFVLNPHGEIDGFVMTGANEALTLVHTPPHLETELVSHVKPGDAVRVRGVRPRGAALLAAVAVTAPDATEIIDRGPDHDREPPKLEKKKMSAASAVRLSLFGPKGELRGALLADGTVIRIGPKEANEVAGLLAPGASVAVSGDGAETKHGRIIHAKEIGAALSELRPITAEKPKPKPKHDEKHGHKHDHGAHA
ncbi:hypothetical protein [Bradyrhizobium sp. ARR65]|uniref:hypothetical protein n=1 Tax=Bradyrhizobium sp. ARR65 TaxID=1040989 RepID=UPI000467C529|nr:hypothetical protein [Bradyrhizobium sp. ARR65]